jgi:hypothetical protein
LVCQAEAAQAAADTAQGRRGKWDTKIDRLEQGRFMSFGRMCFFRFSLSFRKELNLERVLDVLVEVNVNSWEGKYLQIKERVKKLVRIQLAHRSSNLDNQFSSGA